MPESVTAGASVGMTLHSAGDHGLLVGLPGLPEVLSLQAQLLARPVEGQVDVVAAARTVLVTVQETGQVEPLAARLRSIDTTLRVTQDDALVIVEVQYDGADLTEVARMTGLSEEAVVTAHTRTQWTAAFGGFAPGFSYLAGGDPRLEVPRRDSPRAAVPAGAVALAGTFSAVYPRESPGGWQLIGSTDAILWNTHRAEPALIRPGNRVQFRAVRALIRAAGPPVTAPAPPARGGLVVVDPGMYSTSQDLGRPGRMALGVAGAGALDRAALRQANRLVGNGPGCAAIESLNGVLALEAEDDHVLAVAGAVAGLTISTPDGGTRAAPLCSPFLLHEGEVLRQSVPKSGLRTYTAVRGGLDTEKVLGSRSTDSISGLGPPPLVRGSVLAVGPAGPGFVVGTPEIPVSPTGVAVLRVIPGPRENWFADGEVARLCETDWTVTAQSNRIGLRLDGSALRRSRHGELPSEGTVRGALQVPPSGLPVLFLADHPVTGGYPVIAVVVSADLDRAAQLPPGARLRFRAAGYRPDQY